jgi:lipopolysaccharide/colanic/teichoic acid biosynthesis glycosyltransferase
VLTTSRDRHFTPIGRLLRSTKLDELPQLLQVLTGQMSLVGPRPKVAELEPAAVPCRPGITGMATIVFAREQHVLDCIPRQKLATFYKSVVGPAKRTLDAEYMSRATFRSDLRLIAATVFCRWNSARMESILRREADGADDPQCTLLPTAEQNAPLPGAWGMGIAGPVSADESSVA